ncbi:hypothetical protein L6164_004206 [Bauhinia variegata]|uniref:Uncharacterized protein n=1 Tax=Bauhinia variegata TaxID=167791 RepID=A0ACB9Q957_BAUVA|nr:hypothetical protein L6164_004206 [Bauhinia variegata]
MRPCTVLLDDQTMMHFWLPRNRQLNKPNVALIHGYGGNSRWQFFSQVGPLSRRFNLYIPDLLFFGKSYTNRTDRSDWFQARCVGEAMKTLGVDRFSVAGISYGGYVAYRTAEIYRERVEKVVIVSSGICYTDDQKAEELRRIGRNPLELLLPENPKDLRSLMNMTLYKYDPFKWLPNFFLRETIQVMFKKNRKEIMEIGEYLLTKPADSNLGILSQALGSKSQG